MENIKQARKGTNRTIHELNFDVEEFQFQFQFSLFYQLISNTIINTLQNSYKKHSILITNNTRERTKMTKNYKIVFRIN